MHGRLTCNKKSVNRREKTTTQTQGSPAKVGIEGEDDTRDLILHSCHVKQRFLVLEDISLGGHMLNDLRWAENRYNRSAAPATEWPECANSSATPCTEALLRETRKHSWVRRAASKVNREIDHTNMMNNNELLIFASNILSIIRANKHCQAIYELIFKLIWTVSWPSTSSSALSTIYELICNVSWPSTSSSSRAMRRRVNVSSSIWQCQMPW